MLFYKFSFYIQLISGSYYLHPVLISPKNVILNKSCKKYFRSNIIKQINTLIKLVWFKGVEGK